MTDVYSLPGTMCDAHLWDLVQPHLPDEIVLNHVPIPQCSSVNAMVRALLTALPTEPVNLVGFSLGGYLVSELLRHAPERIKRAMIISNTASALPDIEKVQREQALNWVLASGYKGLPIKKAKAMLHPDHQDLDAMLDIMLKMDKSLGEHIFIGQLKATLERQDNVDAIGKSGVPCKVLIGAADPFAAGHNLKALNALDNIELHLMTQSGHMLPLERPKWTAKQIASTFL